MPTIKFEFKVNNNSEIGGTFTQKFSCNKCTEFKHCYASEKRLNMECCVLKTLGKEVGSALTFNYPSSITMIYNPVFFGNCVKKILDTVERYKSCSR